jgi:hypothetical protein
MEDYATLNTIESSIEMDQVTQQVNQKIKRKVYGMFETVREQPQT